MTPELEFYNQMQFKLTYSKSHWQSKEDDENIVKLVDGHRLRQKLDFLRI